jgi:hypothetical protein
MLINPVLLTAIRLTRTLDALVCVHEKEKGATIHLQDQQYRLPPI